MNSNENQSIKAEQDDDFVNKIAEYENYDIERTIEEILDIDTGEIILAADIFENKESFIISVRKTLELAHKSNIFKYLCPYCEQEVRISKRNVYSRNNTTYFFSHYPKSNDCPIKSENNKTLEELLKDRNNDTREGETHKELVRFISDSLTSEISKSKGFYDVYSYKIFKDTNVIEGWRKPDVTAMFGSKKIVLEIQLHNTFLSDIIERDSFYRLHKTYILWIFSTFTPQNEKTVEKDLYYAHKRNIFVLDKKAYYKNNSDFNKINNNTFSQDLSIEKGELVLRCYWQIPKIDENNKLRIEWHHKLVTLDELTFDEEKHEIYYYNSDKDFYEQDDPEKQKIIDDWELEKEKRWNKIFDSIELRRKRKEEWERNKEKREQKSLEKYKIINLIFKIRKGEIELIPFKDENGLYGYCIIDPQQTEISKTIIKPKYSEALLFQNGIGFVKMANWGAISISGKKVIPFQYLSLNWIEDTKNVLAKDKNSKYGIIDTVGNIVAPFIYDKIYEYINGTAKVKKTDSESWNRIANYGFIDENGNEIIEEEIEIGNGFSKGKKIGFWGVKNNNGEIIVPFEYDEIQDFIDGFAKVKKNKKYGFINEIGNEIIPIIYDEIEVFTNNKASAKKNCKFGQIDKEGKVIIPFEYDEIQHFIDGKAIVMMLLEENWKKSPLYGILDETGKEIISISYQEIGNFINGKAIAKKNNYYGQIDENGNEIIPFEFDEINEFVNGIAKAKKNNIAGFIDEIGNEIIQNKIEISEGLFRGEKFGYYGVEDHLNNIICSFKHDKIEVMKNSFICFTKEHFSIIPYMGLIEKPVKCCIEGISRNGIFLEVYTFKGFMHIKEIIRAGEDINNYNIGDYLDLYVKTANEEIKSLSFSILPKDEITDTE